MVTLLWLGKELFGPLLLDALKQKSQSIERERALRSELMILVKHQVEHVAILMSDLPTLCAIQRSLCKLDPDTLPGQFGRRTASEWDEDLRNWKRDHDELDARVHGPDAVRSLGAHYSLFVNALNSEESAIEDALERVQTWGGERSRIISQNWVVETKDDVIRKDLQRQSELLVTIASGMSGYEDLLDCYKEQKLAADLSKQYRDAIEFRDAIRENRSVF